MKSATTTFAVFTALSLSGLSPAHAADYPPLYLEMALPEYPGATVTEIGRSNDTLEDGISVTLETGASYGELRAFYEQALQDAGWALQETPAMAAMRQAGMLDNFPFNALFCKGDGTGFATNTTDFGTVRQMNISVTRGANGC
ncbi:hypothetical protein [Oricola sp.]|uniref:hypothetical protein n=1 Tax=Oricola sp. TaxID=1979950 RepID=UPI0025D27F4F|nr:hypothetical protein [Oricola sp.]MCI5073811.1 hypothetical protein [Oricola sp.]